MLFSAIETRTIVSNLKISKIIFITRIFTEITRMFIEITYIFIGN